MVRRLALLGIAALGALAALAPLPASAADEPTGWAYDVAREMMSPYCPGRTLADCPSGEAETLRTWILVQEAAGRTREDVEEELFERYGDVILAAPRAEGIGLVAYAIPLAAFLGGGLLVALLLRRYTRSAAAVPQAPAGGIDPELERAIDEEMTR